MVRKKKQEVSEAPADVQVTEKEFVDLGEMTAHPVIPQRLEVSDPDSIGFFLLKGANLPTPATDGSAGYDLSAYLLEGTRVQGYDNLGEAEFSVKSGGRLQIPPGARVLIPTGVFLDIGDDYFVNLHVRSGISYKRGLLLTNGVGVIDSDYVEQVFVSLTNLSGRTQVIQTGERIAQLVVMPRMALATRQLSQKPQPKTARNGGFGSTGA